MKNVAFSPRAGTVKVGRDLDQRGSRPAQRRRDLGRDVPLGHFCQDKTFSFRATRSGTIAYVCSLHQGMSGTLTVTR